MAVTQGIHASPGASARPATPVSWWYRHRHAVAGYSFILPFLLIYLVFLIYPVGRGFWISLHDWELVGDYRQYIGFANYQDMFSDPTFWLVLRNSGTFTLLTVPMIVALSLALAMALNRQTRAAAVLRGIFFASSILSVGYVALVWQFLYSPTQGLLGPVFNWFGVEMINYRTNPTWAMLAIVITTVWWGIGFPMLLFLAGLQQIPQDLYEAATLDGAGPRQRFVHITLPLMRRTIILVVVLQTIAHFQVFGQVLLMTAGGPSNSTRSIVQNIYETGFRDWQIGYASSMAMVLFVVIFVASAIQIHLSRRED